jgi:hypothetical protein
MTLYTTAPACYDYDYCTTIDKFTGRDGREWREVDMATDDWHVHYQVGRYLSGSHSSSTDDPRRVKYPRMFC